MSEKSLNIKIYFISLSIAVIVLLFGFVSLSNGSVVGFIFNLSSSILIVPFTRNFLIKHLLPIVLSSKITRKNISYFLSFLAILTFFLGILFTNFKDTKTQVANSSSSSTSVIKKENSSQSETVSVSSSSLNPVILSPEKQDEQGLKNEILAYLKKDKIVISAYKNKLDGDNLIYQSQLYSGMSVPLVDSVKVTPENHFVFIIVNSFGSGNNYMDTSAYNLMEENLVQILLIIKNYNFKTDIDRFGINMNGPRGCLSESIINRMANVSQLKTDLNILPATGWDELNGDESLVKLGQLGVNVEIDQVAVGCAKFYK